MRRRTFKLLVFILLLVPSAVFVWRNRDMPEFAYLHDDGLLFSSAKSIASGAGFRIPSLPENPYQTKFPPLYPAFLSVVWRINPAFPANLRLASLLCWIGFALCVGLSRTWYRASGFSAGRIWLLIGLLAINPYLILFGAMPFSEVAFTCWLLLAFLAARREGLSMAALAGVAAGAAYLTRTAGLALVISLPALMLWRRDFRRAAIFTATMLPAIVGWTLWSHSHLPAAADPTLLYYADYFGYRKLNIGLDNLAVILWKNADQVLYGIGSLILPKVIDTLPVKILTQLIGVAAISGVVRLARKGIALDYALFALVSTGVLLVWHFPPNERLELPLLPLLLVGVVAELEHLGKMLKQALRHKDMSQRVVAAAFGLGAAALFGSALALQGYMTFFDLDQAAAQKRAKLDDLRRAYSWIDANVAPGANILSYDDPLMYLYTGRRGNYMPLLSRWWYSEDHTSIVNAYKDLPAYCRSRGLAYAYVTSDDPGREVGPDDLDKIAIAVENNPELVQVFRAGIGSIYKVVPLH